MRLFSWTNKQIVSFLDKHYSQNSNLGKLSIDDFALRLYTNEHAHDFNDIPETRLQKIFKKVRKLPLLNSEKFAPSLEKIKRQIRIAIDDGYLKNSRGVLEITGKGYKLLEVRYSFMKFLKSRITISITSAVAGAAMSYYLTCGF